jgi:hypothetical protein
MFDNSMQFGDETTGSPPNGIEVDIPVRAVSEPRLTHITPPEQILPEKPPFWCTFCRVKLSEKAWKRHEESQHWPRQEWICMPSDHSLHSALPSADSNCVFCEEPVPISSGVEHLESCSGRAAECGRRPRQERIFSRKEHLKQHIRLFHGVTPDGSVLDSWSSAKAQFERQWACGFCGENLRNWDARATHISKHFRNGCTMDNWRSDRLIAQEPGH